MLWTKGDWNPRRPRFEQRGKPNRKSQIISLFCRNAPRMNGRDVCITRKVPVIEGQNPLNAMYSHHGGQPRIVDLNARHAMRDKQFAPFCVNRQTVGEQSQLLFEEFCSPVRFLRRKSVAVAVERASTRVPEFADILRRIAKLAVASKNSFDCGDYERIIVVVGLTHRRRMLLSRRYGVPAI
jgi:hypothetical protein